MNKNKQPFVFINIPEEVKITVEHVTKQQDEYDEKLKALIDLFRNRIGIKCDDYTAPYIGMAVMRVRMYLDNMEGLPRKNNPEKLVKLNREVANLFNLVNAELKYCKEHLRFSSKDIESSELHRKRLEQVAELARHCAELAEACFGKGGKENCAQLKEYALIVLYLQNYCSHLRCSINFDGGVRQNP